jgi:hypothetical protein
VPKNTKTLLIIAAVAVAAYLGYRWYENKKANASGTNSPTGALGTNLNSVAPELVGGSTGPSVGPALSSPVNITLNENVAPPPVDQGGPMVPANNQTGTGSLTGASSPTTSASGTSSQPTTSPAGGSESDTGTATSTSGTTTTAQTTPEQPQFTAAQVKKAYAKGRAPNEVGKLYINGKWVDVPK